MTTRVVKELYETLFTQQSNIVDYTLKSKNPSPENINVLINRYASNPSGQMDTHVDSILETFVSVTTAVSVVNKSGHLLDVLLRRLLKDVIKISIQTLGPQYVRVNKEGLQIVHMLSDLTVLDLLYGVFYMYAVIGLQVIYRTKFYKAVSGKSFNNHTSASFPGCNAKITRLFMNPDNMKHTIKGLLFISTLLSEIGDIHFIHSVYHYWYAVFIHKKYIEIPFPGSVFNKIKIHFINIAFRTHVAERFLPYIKNEILFVPNLFNVVVSSSGMESKTIFKLYLYVIKYVLSLFSNIPGKVFDIFENVPKSMIKFQTAFREFMQNTFGWYVTKNNNGKQHSRLPNKPHYDISGRINLQILIVYLKIISSTLLLNKTAIQSHTMMEITTALCHFFKHFQSKSNTELQWDAAKPLVLLVKRLLAQSIPARQMNVHTLQEHVFFNMNINNNVRQQFKNASSKLNVRNSNSIEHMDLLISFFTHSDPTFRPALVLYANIINWLVLVIMGSTTSVSGFLEFKQYTPRAIYFDNYININDPKDKRVRAIASWMVVMRLKLPADIRDAYQTNCRKIVFDELMRSFDIKRAVISGATSFVKGVLRFK